MSGLLQIFEPEELFGGFFHRLTGNIGREVFFEDASVCLSDLKKRLDIYYRALGGRAGVELKPVPPQAASFRQNLKARLVFAETNLTRARFDGDHLFLPKQIGLLPNKSDNENIYRWLVTWTVCADMDMPPDNPDTLVADIAFLRFAWRITERVFVRFPGLRDVYYELAAKLVALRPKRQLTGAEAAVETAIIALAKPDTDAHQILDHLAGLKADSGYKPFLPFALWGEITPRHLAAPGARRGQEDEQTETHHNEQDEKTLRARRQKSDQIEKDNSLLLHRFESILSWSEFLNIPRSVDDDDEETARRAANDHDELGLTNIPRKAATKLSFDLDLAPEDVAHSKLAARFTTPEWDYRKNIYYPDHCQILTGPAPLLPEGEHWQPDKQARRQIRAVKRQFEALRPKRERLSRQMDGNELDMDAVIRARCDLLANGESSNRIFTTTRENARDLAVAVLMDTSRSTESRVGGQQVIDIAKQALLALALGLSAVGDDFALYSFSSLKRHKVFVSTIKGFDAPMGPEVFSRIGALRPGFYTRLGAAIRHVSGELSKTASSKRLLLVLTDGKPNDLDHYEGRYGVEDTHRAVREARMAGHSVFGLTIDKKAQSYFPYIFGQGAHAITTRPHDLIGALPQMYRHLVT